MLSVSDTGYPRLRASYTPTQLERDYRPSDAELLWVRSSGKDKPLGVALLTLLKTAQVLGYFVQLKAVPLEMLRFFARQLNYSGSLRDLAGYDASGRRARHLKVLRAQLEIRRLDDAGREVMRAAAREAALVREDVLDLVQRQLEELVRARYELPPFSRVLETALEVREVVNAELYSAVVAVLTPFECEQLERLWAAHPAPLCGPAHRAGVGTLRDLAQRRARGTGSSPAVAVSGDSSPVSSAHSGLVGALDHVRGHSGRHFAHARVSESNPPT